METTITATKIYRKEGTSKAGKPYTRTTIIGETGESYTTFSKFPLLEAIREGATVTMGVTQEAQLYKGKKQYRIDTVGATAQKYTTPTPIAQPIEDPSTAVAQRLDEAIKIMCLKFAMKPTEINPDSLVLAELLRQLYGQAWLKKDMR